MVFPVSKFCVYFRYPTCCAGSAEIGLMSKGSSGGKAQPGQLSQNRPEGFGRTSGRAPAAFGSFRARSVLSEPSRCFPTSLGYFRHRSVISDPLGAFRHRSVISEPLGAFRHWSVLSGTTRFFPAPLGSCRAARSVRSGAVRWRLRINLSLCILLFYFSFCCFVGLLLSLQTAR